MTTMGFLIPEFPAQTHAFFMREREELKKLGVNTKIISTRHPVGMASMASHTWADEAASEASYLSPMTILVILQCLWVILLSGPAAWFRCIKGVLGSSDMSLKERPKMLAMLIAGAYLKGLCKRNNIDHVHIHSCANSANVGMFARLLGGPTYSLTLHGPMQDYGTNQANKWRHASYCIVITNELVDEVNRLLADVPLPPIYLAPMGVNVEDFKRIEPYKSYASGEQIKLVSCGRLNYVKAHDDLIRVVAMLKDKGYSARLNICGAMDSYSDQENYHDTLVNLAKELEVSESVNFLGSVSEEVVKSELEAAHFFCLASLKEPLGVATMEAMAMETPAIVARSPGVSEMVASGKDGVLVDPRAPEQFVEAIIDLAGQPEKTMEIAKAGRETVLKRFHSGISAEKIAGGLEAIS